MTCIRIEHGFICLSPFFRIPLLDGRRVYMSWHNYCGPTFYYDKYENREIEDWWEDPLLCYAVQWFNGRGNKA